MCIRDSNAEYMGTKQSKEILVEMEPASPEGKLRVASPEKPQKSPTSSSSSASFDQFAPTHLSTAKLAPGEANTELEVNIKSMEEALKEMDAEYEDMVQRLGNCLGRLTANDAELIGIFGEAIDDYLGTIDKGMFCLRNVMEKCDKLQDSLKKIDVLSKKIEIFRDMAEKIAARNGLKIPKQAGDRCEDNLFLSTLRYPCSMYSCGDVVIYGEENFMQFV
eukprot:TRINITY_DN8904_c0_g1_i1.p1 TRINITY_DN8904_c0_g1~~TRINITY_DN8904_c0_g1_i1.p1  ORF type:complete len:220 (-),score=42.56 TRINITY_DN8904_c0_g1_i1:159-818(-)